MFGFASFAQLPFSSLPRTGIPAQAALTSQVINAFTGDLAIAGKGSTTVIGQQLTAFTGSMRANSGYYLTGQQLSSSINNVAITAKATTTLTGQELEAAINNLFIVIGYRITGIGLTSAIQSLNVSGKASTQVTGSVLTSALNSVVGKANARGFATSQLLDIYEGIINASGKASVRLDSLEAVITVDNVLVWGVVPDNQNPDWVEVDDSQTEVWASVNSEQTTTWIVPVVNPTDWVIVDDSEDEDWTEVIH